MRLALFAIPLMVALALSNAGASHCTTWSTSETGDGMIVVYNPAVGLYHVWDTCQPECLFSYWAYFESNGIPGLQRADEVRDDTCHGMIEPDQWFY